MILDFNFCNPSIIQVIQILNLPDTLLSVSFELALDLPLASSRGKWGTFETKMCTFTLESTHLIFNKCPNYTHAMVQLIECNKKIWEIFSRFEKSYMRKSFRIYEKMVNCLSFIHSCMRILFL
jgi:hypothetical protein